MARSRGDAGPASCGASGCNVFPAMPISSRPVVLALVIWTSAPAASLAVETEVAPPVVSVIVAAPGDLVERAMITGTLVPRDEILIAPELDGVRVTEVLVEEGDHVAQGQVLARLTHEMLDVQVAQNAAATAHAEAAVAQGRSQIDQAEASALEAKLSLERAQALLRSGNQSEAVMEQRTSASRSADGRLAASRYGLTMAEADLALSRAQRAELDLKRMRTAVRAPVDGIVSRRTARVGAATTLAGEPLFRMIARGLIEFEGEVTETGLSRVKAGAPASIDVGGGNAAVVGMVRVVYPEVDRSTRLGKVKVALQAGPSLRIGAFARGSLEVARWHGLSLPLSALLYGEDGSASVLVVVADRVVERKIRTGLMTATAVAIEDGIAAGDVVVARAGTFLRQGDRVRTAPPAGGRAEAQL